MYNIKLVQVLNKLNTTLSYRYIYAEEGVIRIKFYLDDYLEIEILT